MHSEVLLYIERASGWVDFGWEGVWVRMVLFVSWTCAIFSIRPWSNAHFAQNEPHIVNNHLDDSAVTTVLHESYDAIQILCYNHYTNTVRERSGGQPSSFYWRPCLITASKLYAKIIGMGSISPTLNTRQGQTCTCRYKTFWGECLCHALIFSPIKV